MTATPEIVVEANAESLAADVAARVLTKLLQAQRERGYACLALTGGGILEQVFAALAASSSRDSVDWSTVSVFWGDERFVPADSTDRNDGPARRLLLDALPLDPAHVHPMPTSEGVDGDDVDAAARRYADVLEAAVDARHTNDSAVPAFDAVLCGIGPDGHCCSLFPESPGVYEETATVIGVHNSPKPPPRRLSLTFRSLEAADEVWVIAAGEGKAAAVAMALGGAGRVQVPSAGARGRHRTLWLLDRAAAHQLPRELYLPPVA